MTEPITVEPKDSFNEVLVANAHPNDWKNPTPAKRYNLVVIGAGPAGLVCAAGAAGLGARVALIEQELIGGDCLVSGCVPSKSIIRSSRVAADFRHAGSFGINLHSGVDYDSSGVMERMRRVRAQISPNDSARYYRERGVDVFLGHGEFTGPDTVRVGSDTLRFSKAVITTGAGPRTLPLEGLQEAGFLTNQTIFSLSALPRRLAVIGGGPLGCELAQACARLGGEVTILDKSPRLLPREDPDAATLLGETFVGEGIRLKQGIALTRVEKRKGEKRIHFRKDEKEEMLVVDEILLGAGRTPNVHGLGLEKAGIEYDERKGIGVDEHLSTSNRKVYAAGDCCSKYKFSHVAEAQARMVLQNALFLGRRKTSDLIIPWCTYTDPEIAHTGMYEAEAREKGIDVDTFMVNLGDTDRAVADGEEKGFAKIHTKKGSDKILGATTVGRHAGELISELTLAIVAKVGLKTIANTIHPYPTHSEVMRHVADEYNRSRLTPGVQKLFSKWLQWRR